MVTLLFWNTNGKGLEGRVSRLAAEHKVDVLALAECDVRPDVMLLALNAGARAEFHYAPSYADTGTESRTGRLAIYTRFSPEFLTPLEDRVGLFTARSLALPGRTSVTLCVVHLPSKLYRDSHDQLSAAHECAEGVRDIERRVGHDRTLLIGDLNMDPFEQGVVSAHGLHAVATKQIAARGSRRVESQEYRFFYNPMWGCFGDQTPGPPGTYYRGASGYCTYFWHVFDQVLVRPALLDRLDSPCVRILPEGAAGSSVDDSGCPRTQDASDHLPILFSLDL